MKWLAPIRRFRRAEQPGMTPAEKSWLGFLAFFALILVVDRLTNAFVVFRPWDAIIYLFSILFLGCWAGLGSALGSCAVLVAYVWLIYHFYPISQVVRDPKYLQMATRATAILYPPFALIGGGIHAILRRAATRVQNADAEAKRQAEHRRAAQAELWASEEMRRLIVESSVDAVVVIAEDGNIALWSPNAEKLFGWTREESIGAPAATRLVAHASNKSGAANLFAALDSERPSFLRQRMDVTTRTKSGEPIEVELYVAEHPTDRGEMFFVFAHDISQRKRAETVIRDLNATLEARVAERTAQLEAANEELVGFTYSVSHDLRSPLRAIVSNSRIVCEEANGVLDEELFMRLRRLESSALKMSQLIDNLLQYARIGQVQLKRETVDLSQMADLIAGELKSISEGSVVVQPGMMVEGDPELLEMVLANLMGNAWKYVHRDQAPNVEVGITEDGAVFVRDQGVGFDMKYVDKVWEPFERLHTENEYPGTGIGLANSMRIVQRHGGKMWTESEIGKGTTMYFRLGPEPRPVSDKAVVSGKTTAKAG